MAKQASQPGGVLIRLVLLIATLLVLANPSSAQKIATVTITVAPPIPSTVPQFTNKETFTSAILKSTNSYRKAHNASAVVWNETLASFAADYLSRRDGDCRFAHSGGPYGENIALGFPNATACVEAWGDEGAKYDYHRPGFSEDTGHFTQLVWKDTTAVGCGRRLCGTRGWFLVCEYWPRGNVIGAFRGEVDRPTHNGAGKIHAGWYLPFVVGLVLWMLC